MNAIKYICFLFLLSITFNCYSISPFGSDSYESCVAKESKNITNTMQLEITEKNCRLKHPKLPSVIKDNGKNIICKANGLGPFTIKISKKNKNASINGGNERYPLLYFTESEVLIDLSKNFFSDKKFPARYKIDFINGYFHWIELGKSEYIGDCEEEIN
jgi:hypothetical protein